MNVERNTHRVIESPIGPLTLVDRGGALGGVYMAQHRHRPDPATFGPQSSQSLDDVIVQLGEYFAGRRTEFTVPLALRGTPFQRRVWESLRTIPYGQTWTYRDLAAAVGQPTAVRAVAAANGKNPISIVVPCHRVIGSDGSLTGYAGGLERKQFLLDREQRPA
ncbi:methylated-DNA--[protein]-cysteine S-methyltransferase [Rhodococcus sp. NPDC058521]|uniref:methylated-DNA--[protein]-cysteine S-methyltransferase n=1 Tax=Rhodococcus sp. NPDC058521 TaxID=3346536 RepID=UPI0036676EAF